MSKEVGRNSLETKIKDTYSHLQDEISKQIFQKRLMYSLTGDGRFISEIIDSIVQEKDLAGLMEKAEEVKDRLIIYGAGNDLALLKRWFPDLSCVCLCDGDREKQRTGWNGFRVISREQLLSDYQGYYVLISSTAFQKEIYDFLVNSGWDAEKILNAGSVMIPQGLYERQYFDKEIVNPCPDEIFVDGGCYDCGTDRLFMKWCGGDYKKIYAFEPDVKNYENCMEAGKDIRDLRLINKGLWSREDVLRFEGNESPGSRIIDTGIQEAATVQVAAIDEVVGNDKVTFLKMDIEGAELEALKGARETIRKHHPKLAICIYHKKEDVWEIPAYILSVSEDYRLYIRHYRLNGNETVLYAV